VCRNFVDLYGILYYVKYQFHIKFKTSLLWPELNVAKMCLRIAKVVARAAKVTKVTQLQ